jgi:TolA-binding protein
MRWNCSGLLRLPGGRSVLAAALMIGMAMAASGDEPNPRGRPVADNGTYIVKPGDSIAKIAAVLGTTVESVMVANPLLDARRLKVGQMIKIPSGETARTTAGAEAQAPTSVKIQITSTNFHGTKAESDAAGAKSDDMAADELERIGQYFLTLGTNQLSLAVQIGDQRASESNRQEALASFLAAGDAYGRVMAKFPSHSSAGKAQILAGQCYMRAEKYDAAAKSLELLAGNADKFGKEMVAESMFWCGESRMKLGSPGEWKGGGAEDDPGQLEAAYRAYRRIIDEYPDTKWAKYARGRLADPRLVRFAGR